MLGRRGRLDRILRSPQAGDFWQVCCFSSVCLRARVCQQGRCGGGLGWPEGQGIAATTPPCSQSLASLMSSQASTTVAYCLSTLAGQKLGIKPGDLVVSQADHIRPVAEGGGEADLGGFRTLCTPCHEAVTARLLARLAGGRAARAAAGTEDIRRFFACGGDDKRASD